MKTSLCFLLSVMSVTGGFLVASKPRRTRLFGFLTWVVANAGWIMYCGINGIEEQIPMWGIYLTTSVIGVYNNGGIRCAIKEKQ